MATRLQLDPFKAGPYRFQYPGFVMYLYAFLYSSLFIPLVTLFAIIQHPSSFLSHLGDSNEFLALFVLGKSSINALFWGRAITASLGFVSVLLVYIIGKQMFNRAVGFVAALFLAVNFRHIISSQLSLVDVPNGLAALFVLFISFLLLKKPMRRYYVLAGITVGISLATKLYIFSLFPYALSHVLISLQKKELRKKISAFFSVDFFLGTLAIVVTFMVFNPFLLSHLPQAVSVHIYNNRRYGFGAKTLATTPLWYLFDIGIGEAPVILALTGFILTIINRSYVVQSLYLLLFIFPPSFLLFYYTQGGAYIRNFSSVIPFILVFSAVGLTEIVKKGIKFLKVPVLNKNIVTILFILGLLANIKNIKNSSTMTLWNARPWNYQCIEKEISMLPNGTVIARTSAVPVIRPKDLRYVDFTNNFDHRTAFNLRELQEEEVDYVAIDYSPTQSYFNWWVGGNKFREMPYAILDNTFPGLVFKELSRYSILNCIKPWQSLDHNYSLIRIPPKTTLDSLVPYKRYTFDTDGNETTSCKSGKCLRIKTVAMEIADWILLSEPIPVEQGKLYAVSASIAATGLIPQTQRDGFLRINFYPSPPTSKERGITATVSPRYIGEGWQEKQAHAVAPSGASFMTIGFEAEDRKTDFLIDELQVSVSEKIFPEEVKAANEKEIDRMILYPNSIL